MRKVARIQISLATRKTLPLKGKTRMKFQVDLLNQLVLPRVARCRINLILCSLPLSLDRKKQEVSKKEKPLQHLAEQLDKPVKAKKEAMGPKRPQEHRKAPLRRTPKRLICLPRKRRVTSESSTNFLPYQVLLSFNF